MQIHELSVKSKKHRKTIGRGGKRGTYSGRGGKGQTARSGGKIDPLFEGGRSSLIERLKKIGGFKSIKPKAVVITLDQLDKYFADGEAVTKQALLEKKLVRHKQSTHPVKILTTGKITKKITVSKEIRCSEMAKKAIEKAGGKAE